MDVDDERQGFLRRRLRQVKIEPLGGVAFGKVGEVALQTDAGRELRGRLGRLRQGDGGEEREEENEGFHGKVYEIMPDRSRFGNP